MPTASFDNAVGPQVRERGAAHRRRFAVLFVLMLVASAQTATQLCARDFGYQRVLGRYDMPDSPEVERTFQLFAGIVSDAHSRLGWDKQENYSCRQGLLAPVPDPKYTVRAWRGVITYLLRQQEFLYE
jgi:hypothetical protein